MAFGSRGDVQPYVALAQGLQRAGFDVRLISHENFAELARTAGVSFRPVRGNVQDVAESPKMRALTERGNFIELTREMAKAAQGTAIQWAEDGLAACAGVELIVTGVGGLFTGLGIAEKLNVALMQAYIFPFTPTSSFASVLLPAIGPTLPPPLARASHHITQQMLWQGVRVADNMARTQVWGLRTAPFFGPFNHPRLKQLPILYGISPSVIPKPADWNERIHMTGFWFLERATDWQPPNDLVRFLNDGAPPIYIGFGSMSSRDPQATTELVLRALRQTNQRAIVASGWGGMRRDHLPTEVFMIESIPHTWLFPRMAAVVHHGGVGTTAAGLRAGVPSIVVPFFGDQPFWGQRVAALGVGPTPIPRKQLTTDKLAQAIQVALTDQTMRQHAASLGSQIRMEDGVGTAVSAITKATQLGDTTS